MKTLKTFAGYFIVALVIVTGVVYAYDLKVPFISTDQVKATIAEKVGLHNPGDLARVEAYRAEAARLERELKAEQAKGVWSKSKDRLAEAGGAIKDVAGTGTDKIAGAAGSVKDATTGFFGNQWDRVKRMKSAW